MDVFDFHDNEFVQQHLSVMVHVSQDQVEYQIYSNNSKEIKY